MRTISVPLFATRVLGASTSQLGLLIGLTTATAVVVELTVGRRSDRIAKRHLLIAAAAAWLALGYTLAATTVTAFWWLLPLAPLFFAFAGVPSSQLLTVGRVHLAGAAPSSRNRLMFSTLRACFSVGFALGPLLVAPFLRWGPRRALLLLGGSWAAIAALTLLGTDRRPMPTPPPRTGRLWRPSLLPLVIGFMLIISVDTLKSTFIAVFADRELHAEVDQIALLFTASSALNLVFMPISGAAADRFGPRPVVQICAVIGAVAALGTALATSSWQLIGLQLCHAAYTGGILSVGLSLMQDQFTGRPALGASLYSISFQLSSVTASLAGGLIAQRFGLRVVFGGAAVAAVLGSILVGLATARPADGRASP
jgi:MFS family permease